MEMHIRTQNLSRDIPNFWVYFKRKLTIPRIHVTTSNGREYDKTAGGVNSI